MQGRTEENEKSSPRARAYFRAATHPVSAALPLAAYAFELQPRWASSCTERELVRETASSWEIAV